MNTHMLSCKRESSTVETEASDYAPVRIFEIEVGQPLPGMSSFDDEAGRHYRRALCLVRLHGQPLGMVELELDERRAGAHECAQHIWRYLHVQINEHLQRDGLPAVTGLDAAGLCSPGIPQCIEERERFLADAPLVSVIIPTHDRPERLTTCLCSLLSIHYPQYEVIVVDNAPSTNATADLIRQVSRDAPQVRYLREDRPGPSWARNCGMMEARGEILVFIDDDVVVDPHWLVGLVRAFSLTEDVVCVTSLVLPLELETPAQFWFEEYGGFSKGFTRRIFDIAESHPKTTLYPYIAGSFGTGASMAFTAAFLRSVGGFDPALGGDGAVRCSQDIAVFFQVVTQGHKLVYEPASLVYHLHRRDYAGLRKQLYNYGVGLTAYLTKSMFDNPRLLFDLVTKLPYGLFFILSARSPKNRKKLSHYPKDLTMAELKGMLYGPFAYLCSRWAMRKARKGGVPIEAHTSCTQQRQFSTARALLYQWAKVHRIMLVNAGSLVGTTVVTSLLGFIYWWLAARQFPPEAVGLASAAISAMMLLGSVCILGLGTLLIGELPRQPGKEGSLLSAALILVGGVGGCSGIVFATVAPFVSPDFQALRASGEDIALFAVGVSLTAITLVLDQALIGLLRGELQLWRNTLFAGAKLAALFVVGLWLSHTVGMTIYATWAVGNALSLAVLACFAVFKGGRPRRTYRPQWRLLRKLGPAALQHHILNLTLQAPTLALPLLVTVLLSAKANAWFYVSWMVASFVFVIPTSLTTVLYATSAARPSALAGKIRMTIGLALVASALASCILLLGTKQVLGLFGPSYAEQSAWSLRILALGAFPLIVKNHYVAVCRISDRIARATLPIMAGCLLELGAAAWGARLGGVSGLSLGWLTAVCVEAVFMLRTVYIAVRPVNTSAGVDQRRQDMSEHDGTLIVDTHANELGFG